MAIVVLQARPQKKDVLLARKDHKNYIKITADLSQELIAIGGEYHADAEKVLLEKYDSRQKDIWGGGYDINLDQFETLAIINIRQPENPSMEILNGGIRKNFFKLVNQILKDIKSLL